MQTIVDPRADAELTFVHTGEVIADHVECILTAVAARLRKHARGDLASTDERCTGSDNGGRKVH